MSDQKIRTVWLSTDSLCAKNAGGEHLKKKKNYLLQTFIPLPFQQPPEPHRIPKPLLSSCPFSEPSSLQGQAPAWQHRAALQLTWGASFPGALKHWGYKLCWVPRRCWQSEAILEASPADTLKNDDDVLQPSLINWSVLPLSSPTLTHLMCRITNVINCSCRRRDPQWECKKTHKIKFKKSKWVTCRWALWVKFSTFALYLLFLIHTWWGHAGSSQHPALVVWQPSEPGQRKYTIFQKDFHN